MLHRLRYRHRKQHWIFRTWLEPAQRCWWHQQQRQCQTFHRENLYTVCKQWHNIIIPASSNGKNRIINIQDSARVNQWSFVFNSSHHWTPVHAAPVLYYHVDVHNRLWYHPNRLLHRPGHSRAFDICHASPLEMSPRCSARFWLTFPGTVPREIRRSADLPLPSRYVRRHGLLCGQSRHRLPAEAQYAAAPRTTNPQDAQSCADSLCHTQVEHQRSYGNRTL